MPDQSGAKFTCQSCGGSLQFKSAAGFCLVCPACRALNYQPSLGFQFKLPGILELAPVQEEMSIIRLGTKGVYQDIPFEVIGRVQYFFQERYRNHWFLLYGNGNTGWLGDWDGHYSWISRVEVPRDKFEKPVPGKMVPINTVNYLTEKIDISRHVSGEGELGNFYLNDEKFAAIELYTLTGKLALANVFTDKKVDAFSGHYLEVSELNLQDCRQHHDWV